MRRFTLLPLLLLLLTATLCAHPVAQGSMEIVLHEDHVLVHAKVSVEQVFVAEALTAPGPNDAESTLDQMWAGHAKYLLAHLQVSADSTPLAGQLERVEPPATTALEGRVGYLFHFALPETARHPAKITLSQTVLNEFEFAPGNRWEATYICRVSQPGYATMEGLLLTSREPLIHLCSWSAPAAGEDPAPILQKRALFGAYLHHGIMHILSGYDHLLFMSALVLAVVSWMDLLKVVTAFTVAHTLTLTLSVLDLVRLPSHVVEPMIAASIVVVALQNIFWPTHTRGWSRLLIAFGFGLFHGLGFAGGLLEAMSDLPGLAVTIAIVAFSIGVELGHQVVVLPIFGALQLARRAVPPRAGFDPARYYALKFGSTLVCLAGVFYLVAALRA